MAAEAGIHASFRVRSLSDSAPKLRRVVGAGLRRHDVVFVARCSDYKDVTQAEPAQVTPLFRHRAEAASTRVSMFAQRTQVEACRGLSGLRGEVFEGGGRDGAADYARDAGHNHAAGRGADAAECKDRLAYLTPPGEVA